MTQTMGDEQNTLDGVITQVAADVQKLLDAVANDPAVATETAALQASIGRLQAVDTSVNPPVVPPASTALTTPDTGSTGTPQTGVDQSSGSAA